MVNLITNYAKRIQEAFKQGSLLTGKLSTEYSFTGSKSIKVIIPQTVAMGDYKRSGANRYGEPSEMQDLVQEMILTQDKSFSMTIDKGNNQEQGGLKAAAKMLALQIKERAIPTSDKYGFEQLCLKAGSIIGNSTPLTKANIFERILSAVTALDDAEIPEGNRTLYISAEVYNVIVASPEFISNEKLGAKAIAKGQVGEIAGLSVVKVPKGRWTKNVNFLVVQKDCATFPVTLNETKLHEDPQGISGSLLEGRQIYDLFVFHERCNGIYAEVNTASGKATITATPTISNAGVMATATSGGNIMYTTDGSDPRYSASVKYGTTADEKTAGTVIKAVATKSDMFTSSVVEHTITA